MISKSLKIKCANWLLLSDFVTDLVGGRIRLLEEVSLSRLHDLHRNHISALLAPTTLRIWVFNVWNHIIVSRRYKSLVFYFLINVGWLLPTGFVVPSCR